MIRTHAVNKFLSLEARSSPATPTRHSCVPFWRNFVREISKSSSTRAATTVNDGERGEESGEHYGYLNRNSAREHVIYFNCVQAECTE